MKKVIILIAMIVCAHCSSYSQSSALKWTKKYNGSGNGNDKATAMRVTANGNVYVTGSSNINATQSFDFATIKYNSNGVQQWIATFDGSAGTGYGDGATAMTVDSSGNVYVTGNSEIWHSGIGNNTDIFTVKYNSSGVQQWAVSYSDSANDDGATGIAVDGNGNVFVTGFTVSQQFYNDFGDVTIKYNSNGIQQWKKSHVVYGGGTNWYKPIGIAVDANGNSFIAGTTGTVGWAADNNYLTVKYNTNGVQQWFSTFNGAANNDDYAKAMAFDGSNVYVTGKSFGNGTHYDYATVKYNTNGIQQWVVTYNGPGGSLDEPVAMTIDGSSNVFVTGNASFNNCGTVKYNSSGIQQWVALYYPSNAGTAIAVDGSGNVYVGASVYGDVGFRTIKYNISGILEWTNVYKGTVWDLDLPVAIGLDAANKVYVSGQTHSSTNGLDNGYDYVTLKYANCTLPAIPGSITTGGGISKVCPGETRTYTTPLVSGVTYNWTSPTGAVINSGQGTNSISVTFDTAFVASGILSVAGVNGCGNSASRNLTISRNNPTATITTNGGATTFCSGTNPLILNANAGTGYTYQWKKGTSNISGAINQSYVPTTTSNSYKVVVTNTAGCSKTSAVIGVTVNPLPTATITAQGSTTFCAGDSVILQANNGTGLTYQWKKGANNISSATLQNYTAKTAGTYKVIVTNANSCSKTSSGKVVTVNCRLSISGNEEKGFEVFPNPTNGFVTLKFNSEENQNCELIVSDIAGRELIHKLIKASEGINENNFDMSNFAQGIYLTKFKISNKEIVDRIVKE